MNPVKVLITVFGELIGRAAITEDGNVQIDSPLQIRQIMTPRGPVGALAPLAQSVQTPIKSVTLLPAQVLLFDTELEVPSELEAAYVKATTGIEVASKPGLSLVRP